MNLNGTITQTTTRNVVFNGPVTVRMTIDRPSVKKVQVQLSNNWQTEISGTDYDNLAAVWISDAALLQFIARTYGLTVS